MLFEARFELAKLDDPCFALWSYLHPRQSLAMPSENVSQSDTQLRCRQLLHHRLAM